MAGWQERWVNKYYDRSKGWVDGTTQFQELCRANTTRDAPPTSSPCCANREPRQSSASALAKAAFHGVRFHFAMQSEQSLNDVS